MIRPLVAILMLVAVLVLIAFAVCIENRPQGYAMGWLRAGLDTGSIPARRFRLGFVRGPSLDAQVANWVFAVAPDREWRCAYGPARQVLSLFAHAPEKWAIRVSIHAAATDFLPSMKRRQTPCSSAS